MPGVVAALWLQAASPAVQPGMLAGRVTDGSGAPVAEAVVAVRAIVERRGPPGASPAGPVPVRTDGEGRFVVTNVPAGRFSLSVTKPGWLEGAYGKRRPTGTAGEVRLEPGASRTDLSLVLWRPAVIGGSVTDDNGEPVVNAEVRAVPLVWMAGRRVPQDGRRGEGPVRAKTDDRGVFRFSSLVPGDYLVAVVATRLSEPSSFAGAIRVAGETPAAYLQTMASGTVMPMLFSRATTPVPGGTMLTSALSDLDLYATTFHPASTTQSNATVISVKSGEVMEAADIALTRVTGVTVSGTLTDAGGPAAWHTVHLVPRDSDDRPLVSTAMAVTDAEGRFQFVGVPPGDYVARVVRIPSPTDGARFGQVGGTGEISYVATVLGRNFTPGAPPEPAWYVNQNVSIGNRAVSGVNLVLGAAPMVRGHVEFVGSAPPPSPEQLMQAGVSIQPANGRLEPNIMPSRPDADRKFVGTTVWPGLYVITAQPPAGWYFRGATYQGRDVTDAPLEVTEGVDGVIVTFTDTETRWNGTVQADSGTTLEDLVVMVFPTDDRLWIDYGRGSRRVRSIPVSGDGQFSMVAPPAGEYWVLAIPAAEAELGVSPPQLSRWLTEAQRVNITAAPAPVTIQARSRK